MESHIKLLSEIELSDIKIEPSLSAQEKEKPCEPSTYFGEDPSIRRKKLLVFAYQSKQWDQFAEILKSEFSVPLSGDRDNEIKEIFWQTLLGRPMELEVVHSIRSELLFTNNKADFIYVTNIALNQEYFCNFQQIISINRTLLRKDVYLVTSCVESHIFSQLKIKNFEQFAIENANDNFQINVLKYIIYFDKLEVEKQKSLISKLLALEPRHMFRDYFEILLGILNDNSELFHEKIDSYLELLRLIYPIKEMESISTADLNLIVAKAFASELENVLVNVIKKPLIDINRLTVPHGFFKSEVPLTFFVAERGYDELLQAAFDSKKKLDTVFKDIQGFEISLLTFCIRGFKFYRRLSVRSDFSTDFDACIDIVLKHLPRDEIFYKTHNPMAEAMKYNYNNAAIKLIQKFGLTFQFVQVMNTKVLKKYLDSHVRNTKDGITVNYRFLKDETIKTVMRKDDLKTSIQHPVIANYLEFKYSQFWALHVTDLLLFVTFSISFPTLYFFLRHKSRHYECLLYLSIIYSLLRFGLQLALCYYCLVLPNLSKFSCQSHDTTMQNPLKWNRILSGVMETLYLFLLIGVLFSHLFTNRPEYLFSGSLLLMTTETTKMLSRISPSNVSKYILMFKTVAVTLSITLMIFFWIIVAFTLAFHVVVYVDHPEEISKLETFWTSFTTTMTIFMGGHEGEALKFKGWWNLMLFALFVLTAISLYNLAMDLAMENAKELRDNGDFVSLEKQFNTILEYRQFFEIGSQPVNKIIYTRKPDEATVIEEVIWRINTSILSRLKTFDRNNRWHSEIVQIARSRYKALSLIIKSNEDELIRIDNDSKIDEIEKTVHQVEDLTLRMEHKLNFMRQENDSRRDQLQQIKKLTNRVEGNIGNLQLDCQYKHDQFNRIFVELEKLNLQIREIRFQDYVAGDTRVKN